MGIGGAGGLIAIGNKVITYIASCRYVAILNFIIINFGNVNMAAALYIRVAATGK